jgi:predicted RNase H-like HicB family nuclease
MRNINIQATIWKEGKYYVSQCLNIDVASFGLSKKEALANLQEAVLLKLEGEKNAKLVKIEKPDLVSLKLQYA